MRNASASAPTPIAMASSRGMARMIVSSVKRDLAGIRGACTRYSPPSRASQPLYQSACPIGKFPHQRPLPMTPASARDDPERDTRHSAMLRLTTRIANASDRRETLTGLAFGLMDECFRYAGVEIRLDARPDGAVRAGALASGAA